MQAGKRADSGQSLRVKNRCRIEEVADSYRMLGSVMNSEGLLKILESPWILKVTPSLLEIRIKRKRLGEMTIGEAFELLKNEQDRVPLLKKIRRAIKNAI